MTIHKLFDWGDDPGFGAVLFIYWDQANPNRGQYNWTKLDDALNKIEAQRLPNGDKKPAQVFLQFHESSDTAPNIHFRDFTPQWVYANEDRPSVNGHNVGHVLSAGAKKAVIPGYESEVWQSAYYDMVRAFADHLRLFPCVESVIVSVGLDTETHPAKAWGGIDWGQVLSRAPGGIEYGWGGYNPPYGRLGFIYEAMDVYKDAFYHIQPYLNMAPGGNARPQFAEYAAAREIGFKHSGVLPDAENHEGHGKMVGSWDMLAKYAVPIWTESATDLGGASWMYWALIAALHYHPAGMSLHGGYFTKAKPEWLGWADRYIGVTPATTPDVWCVLRDSEYPLQGTESNGVSGHTGNWEFYLHAEGGTRVWEKDLPKEAQGWDYSRQCRHAGEGIVFTIDEEYFARFSRFAVDITSFSREIPVSGWVIEHIQTKDRVIAIKGDIYIHMVVVRGIEEATEPLPDPAPEPAPEGLGKEIVVLRGRIEAHRMRLLDAERVALEQNDAIETLQKQVAAIAALQKQVAAMTALLARWEEQTIRVLAKKEDA